MSRVLLSVFYHLAAPSFSRKASVNNNIASKPIIYLLAYQLFTLLYNDTFFKQLLPCAHKSSGVYEYNVHTDIRSRIVLSNTSNVSHTSMAGTEVRRHLGRVSGNVEV